MGEAPSTIAALDGSQDVRDITGSATSMVRLLTLGAAIVGAYVVAAQLGFRLAIVAEQVTTVWAPTGIALAALLLGGVRLWPAVWLGAFLANAGSDAPIWTAALIAAGNTLESVAAVWGLRRLRRFDVTLHRTASVPAFIVIAAVACTAISATIGVVALCTAGVQAWAQFPVLWFDWWLGDALGALVVAPALLTTVRHPWSRRDVSLMIPWLATTAAVTHLVFRQAGGSAPHPLAFVVFPIAMGAALTGGPAITALVVLTASSVAIWHTVLGSGPFASGAVHQSLILLQTFMGVLAGTSLVLAAAISERRRSERRERDAAEDLRRRQQMLRLAQQAGGVATFEWDFRTATAHCSAEFFGLLGLSAEDGVMTAVEWERFLHHDDRAAMTSHLARALDGEEAAAADYRIVRADGTTRWLSYSGLVQRSRDGNRMLGTVVDITDRKRLEAELRQQAAELRDAKLAAESANRLKDQFLATLSHELRTPLNAILGYVRMLQTNTIAPAKRQRAMDVIERNALAQNQLVEDLLDMSRITTGKVRLDPQPIPVAAVLREAVEGVRPAADAKGVTLALDFDPFAGTVLADPTRLQQVFWNVLTNAVKFTGEGGRVSISLRHSPGAGSAAGAVDVVVRDTGAGISSEFLPFVFEPFRQGENRTEIGHGGLGLGLAITRQLVELHGGTIAVASAGRGHGATFTIQLPCLADDAVGVTRVRRAAAESEPPVLRPSLAGVNVLLVDDEHDALTMFRDALEDAGASVRAVANAADALRESDAWQPDLLVTDLALPGMDGYELLRALRSKASPAACPAIAVSAYARLDDRSRALAAGFQAHVAKPVDPAALVRTLRAALGESR